MSVASKWKLALKKATQWGTAVQVGAGDGIKITQEGFPPGIPEPIKDENVGDSLTNRTYQGDINVEGPLSMIVRYLGFERILALFMGSDAVTETEVGVAWEHDMRFQPSIIGKFFTLLMDKGIGTGKLWEYPTVKPTQLELSHDAGKLMANLTGLANRCERDPTAQVNVDADLGNATVPSTGLAALFSQLDVKLKQLTGAEGNLDANDVLKVTSISLNGNRNISGDHVSGSNGEIDEPEQEGMPEVQLVLSLPRYTAAADALLIEAQKVQAGHDPKVYKASCLWQGPDVPSSAVPNKYFLRFDFPALTIANAPVNAGSPGSKVPIEFTFDVVTPQVVPNGTDWAWVTPGTDPFRAVMQNDNQNGMA